MPSKKIGKVLTVILSVGNWMQSGSLLGGQIFGFDLDVLRKLQDTRSSERDYTLMHLIVETIRHTCPECLNFADETTVSFKAINNEHYRIQKPSNKNTILIIM